MNEFSFPFGYKTSASNTDADLSTALLFCLLPSFLPLLPICSPFKKNRKKVLQADVFRQPRDEENKHFCPQVRSKRGTVLHHPVRRQGCERIRGARGRGWGGAEPGQPHAVQQDLPEGGPARFGRVHKQRLSKRLAAVNLAGESVPRKMTPDSV